MLCVYDPSGNYSQHAGVVITSIFENTKSKVLIHILHDDTLTEDNQKKFIRTAEKYSQSVEFLNVSEYTKQFTEKIKKLTGRLTIGTLFRLALPEVLNVEKVIYLDCDVLVNLDILELWNIDLENKSLAAVLDEDCRVSSCTERGLKIFLAGCDIKTYFNCGVLLMNLGKIRTRENFFIEVIEWLTHNAHLAPFADQDAINAIFVGDVKIIDEKFNVYDLTQDLSNSIVHFWRSKPWIAFKGARHERLYWKYYLRSAWGENKTPDEIIDTLSDVALITNESFLSSQHYHKHQSQCFKRIFMSNLSRIIHMYPLRIAKLFLKDAFYRVKYKFSR